MNNELKFVYDVLSSFKKCNYYLITREKKLSHKKMFFKGINCNKYLWLNLHFFCKYINKNFKFISMYTSC